MSDFDAKQSGVVPLKFPSDVKAIMTSAHSIYGAAGNLHLVDIRWPAKMLEVSA